jgi:nucleoside-diphosphate kinase
MKELTFSTVKPDAMAAGLSGKILDRLLAEGFVIRGMKCMHLAPKEAEGFYAEHKEKPFFPSLVRFMTEGPILVMALEKEAAVADLRKVMGATDPAEAAPGTLRKLFGTSKERNAIHGSANPEDARREVAYFFAAVEIQ